MALVAAVCMVGLAGCAGESSRARPGTQDYPVDPDIARQTGDQYTDLKDAQGALLGDLDVSWHLPGWLGGDGGDDDDEATTETAAVAPNTTGIAVNGYLWGAALDAVSFMPVDDADPESGIIKTGWYQEPDRPDQRYRVNVFILSGELRADGVRVGVFRQVRDDQGAWADAEPLEGTASSLEDLILRRARELRTSQSA